MTDGAKREAKSALQHGGLGEIEEMLNTILSRGAANVKMLDAELESAKSARKNAMDEVEEAKRVINGRFDTLQKFIEDARGEALNAVEVTFAEQEQRLTFDINTTKARKEKCLLAMQQARDAYDKFRQIERVSPRNVYASATSAEPSEELSEKLQHARAEVEMSVRHVRGIRVSPGAGEPFDKAAVLVRGLASDARAEATDELPESPLALERTISSSAIDYRRNDRKFLVLSAATEKRALDVCAKIRSAVGRCYVDNYKANETLISYEDIARYDAVLVWIGGCASFAGGAGFGSLLARYVAQGGGVVVCPWSLATDDDGEGLRGEIIDSGLLGTRLGDCMTGERLTWGDRTKCHHIQGTACAAELEDSESDVSQLASGGMDVVANHPLMNGVHFIDGGDFSGHHGLTILDDEKGRTECAAMWSDGTPLAIVNHAAGDDSRYNTAVINLYPVSSDFSVRCWDTATDFALLLANALHIVSKPL